MKTIYIIRGATEESYKEFNDRILDLSRKVADSTTVSWASVTLSECPPPRVSVIPFKKGKIASLSAIGAFADPPELITRSGGFAGAYQVTEALPVSYSKTWPDGQRTPGACLLTLFKKKKSLDYETFIDRWHNSHTPLSLKIHPLWHYNRNVVDKRLTDVSEPWGGIVEEHFRERRHLTNPFIFFGNPLTMWHHMIQVYMDTRSFLDYSTIEPYLVQEYVIRSR